MAIQLNDTAAWKALASHHAQIKDAHLRQLFADDPGRGERLTTEGAGLYLDYSKNRITDETVRLLLGLAAERRVAESRDAMFRGEKINAVTPADHCIGVRLGWGGPPFCSALQCVSTLRAGKLPVFQSAIRSSI
jgi:hypothetical protein